MIFERFPLGNLEKILKIIREYSSKCSKQFHFWQQKIELKTDMSGVTRPVCNRILCCIIGHFLIKNREIGIKTPGSTFKVSRQNTE